MAIIEDEFISKRLLMGLAIVGVLVYVIYTLANMPAEMFDRFENIVTQLILLVGGVYSFYFGATTASKTLNSK